ncbi:MAG: transglutaminase domain-containing protein [Saprospiraceae bacterium]|nr:transglutaminase domain-containing protein [Saprospiraceae bacterium]
MSTNALIRPTTNRQKTIYRNGDTDDIIDVILQADKLSAEFTQDLAPTLRGSTTEKTLHSVWAFVKENIRYKRDKAGHERIKSPGKLWLDKSGDCKSFSVFIASVLQNLGIPYKYRFGYYPTGSSGYEKDVNHVFVVAYANGREYILDAVLDKFNYQEPFESGFDLDPNSKGISGIEDLKFSPQIIQFFKWLKWGLAGYGLYRIIKANS